METLSESAQSLSGASSAESFPPTKTRKSGEIKKRIKFHSCQDLHVRAKYKRNRYQHVNSKVKEYIASLQVNDRRRKEICKSLPETLNELKNIDKFKNDDFNDNSKIGSKNSTDDNLKMQNEIIKGDNQTLQRILDEKQQFISKLKRDLDTLKYELRKAKEQNNDSLKNQNQKYSNGDLCPKQVHRITICKATQTDVPISLEKLAIDTDSESNFEFLENSNSDETASLSVAEVKQEKQKNTKQLNKKRKFKKNFWSQFTGCFRGKKDQYDCSYMQLPDGK